MTFDGWGEFRFPLDLNAPGMRAVIFIFFAFCVGWCTSQEAVPLAFEIEADPSALAVQFDVGATGPALELGLPLNIGGTSHRVESRKLESGVIRHVVYSRSGEALGENAKISVSLVVPEIPASGILMISGVIASDANGQSVPAALNTLPVRTGTALPHRRGNTGISMLLSSDVVDPDGTVESVEFRAGADVIGTSTLPSQSLSWTPQNAGGFRLSTLATDNDGGQSLLDLGSIGVLGSGNITNFSQYADIFFGPGAPLSVRGFDADPNGTGLQNGLTYLLGLNPETPDRSRLPASELSVADGGGPGDRIFVFRFLMPEGIEDADWIVRQSPDLAAWMPVPAEQITETPVAGGRIQVEARVPAPAGVTRLFLGLQVVPVE